MGGICSSLAKSKPRSKQAILRDKEEALATRRSKETDNLVSLAIDEIPSSSLLLFALKLFSRGAVKAAFRVINHPNVCPNPAIPIEEFFEAALLNTSLLEEASPPEESFDPIPTSAPRSTRRLITHRVSFEQTLLEVKPFISELRRIVRKDCGLRCTVCRLPLPSSSASIPIPELLQLPATMARSKRERDEAQPDTLPTLADSEALFLARARCAASMAGFQAANDEELLFHASGAYTEGGGGEWECSRGCSLKLSPVDAAIALFLRKAIQIQFSHPGAATSPLGCSLQSGITALCTPESPESAAIPVTAGLFLRESFPSCAPLPLGEYGIAPLRPWSGPTTQAEEAVRARAALFAFTYPPRDSHEGRCLSQETCLRGIAQLLRLSATTTRGLHKKIPIDQLCTLRSKIPRYDAIGRIIRFSVELASREIHVAPNMTEQALNLAYGVISDASHEAVTSLLLATKSSSTLSTAINSYRVRRVPQTGGPQAVAFALAKELSLVGNETVRWAVADAALKKGLKLIATFAPHPSLFIPSVPRDNFNAAQTPTELAETLVKVIYDGVSIAAIARVISAKADASRSLTPVSVGSVVRLKGVSVHDAQLAHLERVQAEVVSILTEHSSELQRVLSSALTVAMSAAQVPEPPSHEPWRPVVTGFLSRSRELLETFSSLTAHSMTDTAATVATSDAAPAPAKANDAADIPDAASFTKPAAAAHEALVGGLILQHPQNTSDDETGAYRTVNGIVITCN